MGILKGRSLLGVGGGPRTKSVASQESRVQRAHLMVSAGKCGGRPEDGAGSPNWLAVC